MAPMPTRTKRAGQSTQESRPAKRARATQSNPSAGRRSHPEQSLRDESISGSDVSDAEDVPEQGSASESEDSDAAETAAEKRLRLAEQYLKNIQGEINQTGFDAAEIDRDLIARRLQEDVAEEKGRIYRFIASKYDFTQARQTQFRSTKTCVTAVAACDSFCYTANKDGTLTKWEIPSNLAERTKGSKGRPLRRRPIKICSAGRNGNAMVDGKDIQHKGPILCIAASSDGQFVATGGRDKRLIIWAADDLRPLRLFTQHRAAVTSLAFRRGTNQMYSGSADRTVKVWSLDELAYVETLFGHQDEVVDVAALAQERCVTAGTRDRTLRLWKITDETQLVFRGGGTGERHRSHEASHSHPQSLTGSQPPLISDPDQARPSHRSYVEGSIDRVTMLDENLFASGSDNGCIALWSAHKKKPAFTIPVAHGENPSPALAAAYAEQDLTGRPPLSPPTARWITALRAVPYSDLLVSGSSDGRVRVWQVGSDKNTLQAVADLALTIPSSTVSNSLNTQTSGTVLDHETDPNQDPDPVPIHTVQSKNHPDQETGSGYINDLAVFERGSRGAEQLCIVVAMGREHRLGRWTTHGGRNGAVLVQIPLKGNH